METLKRASMIGAGHTPLNLALLGLLLAALALCSSSVYAQSVDPTGIIQSLLPQEAKLLVVKSEDLNGDKIPEIVVSYKVENLPPEQGVIVLQQKGGRWEKVWGSKKAFEGSDAFAQVDVRDLMGDGRLELLIGWMTGYASAGNELEVYGWKDETLKKLASTGYHQLEFLPPKQGKTALAIWQKDTGLAFMVKTLLLEEQGWVNADEQYAEYFREVIVPYYQQAVEQMPGARFYWYYLAEAQVKARMPQEALKSIENGLSIKGEAEYPAETSGFKHLKEEALLQLKEESPISP